MSLLGREETPEDSEPLIATKLTVSGGESNVHFVPEGPEDEESSHIGEEKSLIHHELEERPRLPTPPPSLTKVVSFGDVTNTPPLSSYPSVEEDTILPPPKQFHPKHRHTSSISIAAQAYPKTSYASQQYQPPLSALRRRSSVKSASGGTSSSANLQVVGSGSEQRRRTSVPVMPSTSGHGNLQQIASYPADSVAVRSISSSYPAERFYAPAHSESTSSDIGRREKVRLQRQGTGDKSVSSDILNVGTRGSTAVGSAKTGGGGKGSPPPYLLNGGGKDLLTTGGNASSPNVASMVKTSPGEQGKQDIKFTYVTTT